MLLKSDLKLLKADAKRKSLQEIAAALGEILDIYEATEYSILNQ